MDDLRETIDVGGGGVNQAPATATFERPGLDSPVVRHEVERVSTGYTMAARLEARIRIAECNRPAGPQIGIQGVLALSGLEAQVLFRHSPQPADDVGTQSISRVVLVPPGERLARRQHLARGIRGPARIHVGLSDGQGRELIPERELCDCVDGITNLDLPFTFNISAVIWVAARAWSEQRGPLIRLSSEVVSARGVTVRLVVRSIRGHVGGPGEGVVECPLVHPGSVFYSRDKTLDSGSPGPVWVLVRFVGEGGRAIGEEQLVGRCVRLHH